jgi:exopolysaccharide biosynthesis polyprenyl glycosylphosphotransferase
VTVSSTVFNPESHGRRGTEWAARLIPGVAPAFRRDQKKLPRSAKPDFARSSAQPQEFAQATKLDFSQTAAALLLPSPLRSRTSRNWLRLVTSDFAFVSLNWLLVGALRVRLGGHAVGILLPLSLLGIALLHAGLITLLGYSEGLYATGANLPQQGRTLGKSVLWATALLSLAYSMQGAPLILIALAFGAGLLDYAVLFAWRWEDLRRERLGGQSGGGLRNVLIIGAGGLGRHVAAHLERHPEEGRTLCGFLDDERPLGNGIIGRVNNLARLARTAFVDEVLLATPHDRELTLGVLHEARRLRLDVEMVPDLFGCSPERAEVERLGDLPLICLHEEVLPAAGLMVKRALDIIVAGGALLMLAPLLALIAGLVKLDSRGPALYAAQRAGRKGRLFPCYKFRTMVSNAEDLKKGLRSQNQRSGPIFKITDDPRITRVGRLLRRYSLDELPQLWNVLGGEMSLVGPRPHPLDDFAAYQVEHLARLDVTPGITGLWQVTARRDPSFQNGVALDREYIRTWNLGMDARILLKTVKAVVRGSGD